MLLEYGNTMTNHGYKEEIKVGKYETKAVKIGQLVDKKNEQYGDAINVTGQFLELLYPNGIPLSQYNNVGVLVRMWDKMKRIANGNLGDEDAFKDLCGYALLMMLDEEDDF
jgi:hypothetical protein